MSENRHSWQGTFRAWKFFASFDQFFFLDYDNQIFIKVSGINYGEFVSAIDNPTVRIITDPVVVEKLAREKNIFISKFDRIIRLENVNTVITFLAKRVSYGRINVPHSEDELFSADSIFID